jgi:hypothetical protein
MKPRLILGVIVTSVGYSGAVHADDCQHLLSCHTKYENCLMAASGTPAQCKLLYQASMKEGGVWGSQKARAASKTTGDQALCHVDFE